MLKIVGVSSSEDTIDSLAKQLGVQTKFFQKLKKHQFIVKDIHRAQAPFIMTNPLTLADTQNSSFYMPYKEVKIEGGFKRYVLSEVQKQYIRHIIHDSHIYVKVVPEKLVQADSDAPGLLKKAEQTFIPKYDL
jgi:hypothetical protein